jgi:predicted ATP-grasp superfamily ATP-dependent carboligase
LKAINYYGLVEIEFKQDPRDGQYKLLDVNARTWGFHSLGFPAGVDFPYLLYADQLGEQLDHCRGQSGIGWLRLITDLPTAFSQLLLGQLGVSSYLNSLQRTRVESVFNWRDPLPSLGEAFLLPYLVFKKYF